MDLQHDPEDEDAFAAVRQALVERFEATPAGADRGWVADQLLDFKHSYLDGHLGRWTADDLSEMLFEIYPRKVVLEPADHPDVISGIAAFLRFLDAEGLRTGGQDGETLASFVEQAGPRFDQWMADRSKWGMGKRVFGGAAAQGVDVSDQAQLDAYVQAFNALPDRERDALLGRLPTVPAPRTLPPVVLAPHEELLPAAEASTLLGWVRGLVEYVGAGVKLTDKGNLRLADARELVRRLGTDDRFDEVIGDRTFAMRSSEELPDLHLTVELATAAGFLVDDGSGAPWYVLSAEHGLVTPDSLPEPYDRELARQSVRYREAWGAWAAARLEDALGDLSGKTAEVHAGEAYAGAIREPLRRLGARVNEPLHGLTFGRHLSWYDEQAGARAAAHSAPPGGPARHRGRTDAIDEPHEIQPFAYRWPDAVEEFVGGWETVVLDRSGRPRRVRHGTGSRQVYGRHRAHSVTFLDASPSSRALQPTTMPTPVSSSAHSRVRTST